MLHQYMYDTDTDTQHTSALGIITAMLTLTTRKLESKFHRCYSLRSSMIARHVPDLRTTVDLKPICTVCLLSCRRRVDPTVNVGTQQ